MDTMDEMDKFLEMYNLPILNQGEIDTMNRPIINNESESILLVIIILKNSQQTKVQDKMDSKVNFTSCLKKIVTYPFPLFKKIEQEGMRLIQ